MAQDYHSGAIERGAVVIKIQKILHSGELNQNTRNSIRPALLKLKILLIEDIFIFVPESSVQYQENMKLNYLYESKVQLSLQQQALQQQQHQTQFIY